MRAWPIISTRTRRYARTSQSEWPKEAASDVTAYKKTGVRFSVPAEVIIRMMDYDEGEEDDVIGELELPIKKTLQVRSVSI